MFSLLFKALEFETLVTWIVKYFTWKLIRLFRLDSESESCENMLELLNYSLSIYSMAVQPLWTLAAFSVY
jgi:hypothetical protein